MADNENPKPISALARALAGEPLWSWTRNYNPNLYEHMHALGVIAANYNRLEAQLRFLLNSFMSIPMISAQAGDYLFERLSNAERMDFLKRLYNQQVGGTNLAERLDWFIKGYGICVENRNILMHSEPHSSFALSALGSGVSALQLRKASKSNPGVHNFISLELKELRQVADDIDAFDTFGFDLVLCQIARGQDGVIRLADRELRPTLPDKPPEPIRLTLSPQKDANSSPPQPESSGA